MTLQALYRLEAAGVLRCPITGVAKDNWSHEQLIDAVAAAVKKSGDEPKTAVMAGLTRRLSYLQGDFSDPATIHDRAAVSVEGVDVHIRVDPRLFRSGTVPQARGQSWLRNDSNSLWRLAVVLG